MKEKDKTLERHQQTGTTLTVLALSTLDSIRDFEFCHSVKDQKRRSRFQIASQRK
jgi:hypothetical protein